jgi:hypothetical protein
MYIPVFIPRLVTGYALPVCSTYALPMLYLCSTYMLDLYSTYALPICSTYTLIRPGMDKGRNNVDAPAENYFLESNRKNLSGSY